jgi:Holliday junction resolvasome RuvABC endonuclease subunit
MISFKQKFKKTLKKASDYSLKKPLTDLQRIQIKHKLVSLAPNHVFFGIDMSVSNPGVCIFEPNTKYITLYHFRNRTREKSSCIKKICHEHSLFRLWTLETVCIEHKSYEKLDIDLSRFKRFQTRIIKIISVLISHGMNNPLIHMIGGVENYIMNTNMKNTKADSDLKEIGGILRNYLYSAQNVHIMEIPPTSVKKLFSGSGKSSKYEMLQAYTHQWYLPDLYSMLNIQTPKQHSVIVAKPIEDLVDSVGVALTVVYFFKQM